MPAAILTVTLNPALDLSTATDRVVAGPKLRCEAPVIEPGGGGVNVARAIRALGGAARAFVALGGRTGEMLRALAEDGGLEVEPFAVPGETRQSLAVTERASGGQFRFVLPGPAWDAGLAARARGAIAAAAGQGALVVLSGSQPPGVPEDFPVALAAGLAGRAAQLLVDTSGAPLRRLAAGGAGLAALRIDEAEAEEIAGRPLATRAESLELAAALVARGTARIVVLARGEEGSVLAAEGLRLACVPPRVPVASKVGAGDSFTAAFALALAQGLPAERALAHGTAAAAAAVMTPATGLCRREDFERLLPLCRIEPG